jgi:Oxidoreductase molybdopterin binding domain
MPHQTVKVKEHGKEATYEGVLVRDVLTRPGVPLGKELRGKAMSTYVLATGRDGYAVVFSLTEFDPAFQDSDILLADNRDGKGLDEKEGPLRIVVPHDKKPARSVRMLEKLDVVQLRK